VNRLRGASFDSHEITEISRNEIGGESTESLHFSIFTFQKGSYDRRYVSWESLYMREIKAIPETNSATICSSVLRGCFPHAQACRRLPLLASPLGQASSRLHCPSCWHVPRVILRLIPSQSLPAFIAAHCHAPFAVVTAWIAPRLSTFPHPHPVPAPLRNDIELPSRFYGGVQVGRS